MQVAIYARVSTAHQIQTQTIDQQLDRLRAHVAAQGGDLTAALIFRDDGYSGATLRRPGLDRLRDAVARGEVTHLLITDPDRLARNYVHQVLLLEEFQARGCQVTFLDRPMGQDPHDQLLLQIRGAVAEYERSLIAERLRRGRRVKFEAGLLLPWTLTPFGYRTRPDRPRDPAGVVVEPAEAAAVREMFTWYAEEGRSFFGLARRLQALGVLGPHGQRRWSLSTLRRMLTNPVYTGVVYIGRTRPRPARRRHSAVQPVGRIATSRPLTAPEEWTPVATVPALVSPDLFARVQAKLAENRRFAPRHNTRHHYLLRALVSCGLCRLSCTGRGGTRPGYTYYVCKAKSADLNACRDARCPGRFIPSQQLDILVWEDLCAVLTHPEQITQALVRAHAGAWAPQELQARRDVLRQGRAGLVQRLDRLTEAYLGAVIPLDEYRRRRGELEGRLQALDEQERQVEAQVAHQLDLAGLADSLVAFCTRVQAGVAQASFEQRRQLVELLIDRVVVTGEEVEIRYVLPTSPQGELVRFCDLRADYYNERRPHQGLDQRCPIPLVAGPHQGDIQCRDILGGILHDYERQAA